jgi:hypothetical protein
MSDIDFGLAWDFTDPADGVHDKLQFQRNWAPPGDQRIFDGTGQLVAVVADARRPANGHTIAISRPNVAQPAVEAALDGWESRARVTAADVAVLGIGRRINTANLATIRGRIHAAGLD